MSNDSFGCSLTPFTIEEDELILDIVNNVPKQTWIDADRHAVQTTTFVSKKLFVGRQSNSRITMIA